MLNSAFEHVTRIRCEKYGLDEHGNLNGVNPLASDLRDSIDHLAQGLYTRNAHFIFELIQNAEDNAYGNKIEPSLTFRLLRDDPTKTPGADGVIIVENNELGFSPENIDAICAVGKSTKKKQEGFIGEKGIGFKSIFRVTSIPFLFSNGYRISLPKNHKKTGLGFIVPEWVENIPQIIDASITSIVLPLDQPDFGYDVVKKMLWEIEPETILFLSKLKEIKIVTDHSEGFTVIKDDSSEPNIQLLTNKNGYDEIFEFLLFKRIFDKPKDINHEKRTDVKEREVSIAFPVGEKPNSAGKLFAYLPVRYDTGFPFIINADFILPSSREDIQDTPWNREWLMPCVGALVSISLPILKDNKQLSISFLHSLAKSVLLLNENNMYYPIAKAVKEAFTTLELIPTDDGSFVSAGNAKLASADWLRKLLREEQLKLLYKKELKWVHGDITDKGRHELWKYFREELKVDELTPDGFARRIDLAFLSNQSDQWIIDFYTQLPNQKALWKKGSGSYWDADGPLRKRPFVRLQDGSHVRPFDDNEKPNAYLTTKTLIDARLPTVKTEITSHDEARRFLLSDLKVPEFDIVAEVTEHVIPKYTSPNLPKADEHERDIEKIIEAFQTDSQENRKRLKDALQETPFILSRSLVSGDEAYRRPDALYFQDEPLEIYFSENPEVGFVSSSYQESALEIFANLGVSSEIRVKCKPWTGSHDYVKLEYQSGYRRGLRGFDPDISVEGLSQALLKPSMEKSQIIWNKICLPYSRCIKGKILRSSRQDFSPNASTYKEEEFVSEEFGKLLINSSWLPTEKNGFKKPTEISLEELPNQFERDEKLADFLGMRKTEKVKAADILSEGNPRKKELLERISNASDDELERFEKLVPRSIPPPPAPSFREGLANMNRRQHGNLSSKIENSEGGQDNPVRNPERYQNNLDDAVTDGVEEHKTIPHTVQFSPVRDKPDNKEAREFLYVEYHGLCQIKGTTFPKAAANSEGIPENYFEACSLLPYSNACYLNDAGNMLCVSADTMAKLKYASFEWLDDIKDIIAEFEDGGGKAQRIEIKIKLAGEECVITWSQRHFMRLISLYKQT